VKLKKNLDTGNILFFSNVGMTIISVRNIKTFSVGYLFLSDC
jgi:hypothetical protein